jgi:hypothetical protein
VYCLFSHSASGLLIAGEVYEMLGVFARFC